ncbi:conserved hypothetical protein [Microsporum canis CBS 113480]|uniref:Protein kinase domain-containing protein n=1 Tax=Arthroderma otae (strain ATCC MYA-4605 / CBS 113480) TaxID=554155 RepID=C5FT30_ARTOC|nr:conserved hypothetical protein [Microsporum canis CBS 113480]EEQ33033.1 conserved hypothetical protein [Microsporum canis CBS 113480]
MAYALTEPLYPRFSNGLNPHVWKATSLTGNNVVVKLRRDAAQSAAEFQKEVSQCQRFKGAAHIRQLLDVIKDETPSKDFDRGMVLEWLPETLWDVRENGRLTKFGLAGIRKIMRDALEGIEELHAEGVIHLASPPSTGVAQPMPYRSPEILFGLRWSKEVDIWGWAMVIYEERVRVDVFHDFKLYNIPFFEQCKDSWPELDPEREEVTIRSILEYLQFPEEDIHLLERVMVPEPKARPTAKDILRQGWIITRE